MFKVCYFFFQDKLANQIDSRENQTKTLRRSILQGPKLTPQSLLLKGSKYQILVSDQNETKKLKTKLYNVCNLALYKFHS